MKIRIGRALGTNPESVNQFEIQFWLLGWDQEREEYLATKKAAEDKIYGEREEELTLFDDWPWKL